MKTHFSDKKGGAGFTLIELMIVVAIIGILAAIAVPKFSDMIRKSQEGATKGRLSTLRAAIHIYYGDNEGAFPADDLACLTVGGKYISTIPEVYVPRYHGKNTTVKTNTDYGMGIMLTADTGEWLYWNWVNDLPERHWGDVWVGCTHTDARGDIWTTF
ncbi:MAG: hypothetical protein A2X28_07350 [Elusimicrobia bacterium GWA2_56_46]|nr:MAG: hypothetical protein A2X28_07350 [Elusimicrobia bacterium GWA2_56_46]OGR54740.1 MAG: hypothetical protein A2X39_10640 [Elusimicrobia bacterium GWC2_56_31]HBB67998.1 hypothetical protein [Elusimicrobiota bacterium]HBW23470.1 hypothetical protein [Elusimicrobiota bacterium]